MVTKTGSNEFLFYQPSAVNNLLSEQRSQLIHSVGACGSGAHAVILWCSQVDSRPMQFLRGSVVEQDTEPLIDLDAASLVCGRMCLNAYFLWSVPATILL